GFSGQPLITIRGMGNTSEGFTINGAGHGTTLRGLVITGFRNGVMIQNSAHNTITQDVVSGNDGNGVIMNGSGATGNVVTQSELGTDWKGSGRWANEGYGIVLSSGASRNTIGGTSASIGNVISGNQFCGVMLTDQGTM